MRNTEIFNLLSMVIFIKCQESYPKRINILDMELSNEISKYYPTELCEDIESEVTAISGDTINSLKEFGYISTQGCHDDGFVGVKLTEKGLTFLNNTPDLLNKPNTSYNFKCAIKQGERVDQQNL